MKRKAERILSLALVGTMLLSLTGCGEKEFTAQNASDCVQAELDTAYKGIFDSFVKLYANVDANDAGELYHGKLQSEAGYFMSIYGLPDPEDTYARLEPGQEQTRRARDLYRDIYARADYSVVSSGKQDDGTFAVKVTVRPMNIIKLLNDNLDSGLEELRARFDAADGESMSDEEFSSWYARVFAGEYYDALLDVLEAQIPNIGYLDEKSIVIQVRRDEEGVLSFGDEDWGNLDNMVIDYTI